MYFFELKNEKMVLGFGTDETIVENGIKKFGEDLIGVYKDNNNAPFVPVWKKNKLSSMKVRFYPYLTSGKTTFYFSIYVATLFEYVGENKLLYICFCVPGEKELDDSKEKANQILAKRFLQGHKSFRAIEVTPSICNIRGVIESIVKAVVVETILKDQSLIPSGYRKRIHIK